MKTNQIRSIIFLMMLVISVVCGCSDKQKNADEYLESARGFLAQKKPEVAVIEFKNAIQLDPSNDAAYFELAETYILLGKLTQAIKNYNLAVQYNPEHIPALLRLAQIHMSRDQLLDARDYVSRVLSLEPKSVKAFHILSGIQIKERDMNAAIETLSEAASIDQDNIETLILLAKLQTNVNSLEKAETTYLKAIALDSSARQAYMGLVKLYAGQRQWDKIERLFEKLISREGSKVEKYTDFARFYEGREKYDEAESYFQKAILEAENGSVTPLMNLAEFYTKRNMQDKAIVTMENALARQPKNPKVLSGMAQLYLHFGMLENAEKTINAALEIDDKHIDALIKKSRFLMAKENYKVALDVLDQVLAIDRMNAKAYFYRAICIQERGATDRPEQKIYRAAVGLLDNPEEFEQEQVKNNFLAAIAIDPFLVDARIRLGQIYLLEKNITKAKEQVKEILKQQPTDIQTLTLVSGINILEGNIKGAEEILIAIIKEKPDYIPALIRLGLLYKSENQLGKAITYFEAAFVKNQSQVKLIEFIVDIYLSQKNYTKAFAVCRKYQKAASDNQMAFFENQIGEIYLAQNNDNEAINHFKEAINLDKEYISPRMNLGTIQFKSGDSDNALDQYLAVAKISPGFLPAMMRLALIYDANNDLPLALKYYQKVLEIEPRHPYAANNLAFILSEDPEQLEEAFRLVKIAKEKLPRDPNVMDTMGWIYYLRGNYLSALSELKESLRLQPESTLTMYHYGMALYSNQEFEKARKYLNKALKKDPNFRGAQDARKVLN